MTRKDLEPLIGTRGRVSEILNRKRPMTMVMIRRIHKALQIPAEVLIQPYETEGKGLEAVMNCTYSDAVGRS